MTKNILDSIENNSKVTLFVILSYNWEIPMKANVHGSITIIYGDVNLYTFIF